MRFCELFHSVHEIIQLYLIKLGLLMSVKDLQKSICMKQISVRGGSNSIFVHSFSVHLAKI